MEQKKTMNRGMAVLLSAALVPTVGVPATAFAEELDQVQGGAQNGTSQDGVAGEGQQGAEGESTPEQATAVAQIGGSTYATLAEAVEAAEDGDEIVLLEDVTIADGTLMTIDKSISLVVAGHTVTNDATGKRPFYVTSSGALLLDASAPGSKMILSDGKSYGWIEAQCGASLRIKGGEFRGSTDRGTLFRFTNEGVEGSTSSYFELDGLDVMTNNGVTTNKGTLPPGSTIEMRIKGGNYVSDSQIFYLDTMDRCPIVFDSVAALVKEGSPVVQLAGSDGVFNDCEFVVEGRDQGSYVWTDTTIGVGFDARATINGGTYMSAGHGVYIFNSGGQVVVNGGVITGEEDSIKAMTSADQYKTRSEIIVNGGVLNGPIDMFQDGAIPATAEFNGGVLNGVFELTKSGTETPDPTVSITAGSFNPAPSQDHLAEGVQMADFYDGDPGDGGVLIGHYAGSSAGFDLSQVVVPSKQGYVFKGWMSSLDQKVYGSSEKPAVEDGVQFTAQWSKYVPPTPPAPAPDTDVEQRPDGSTVTTVTRPDGSQTVTTEAADGSQSVVSKDADGNVTSVEASVPEGAEGAVTLPMDPVEPSGSASAPEISVDCPAGAAVTVPVAGPGGEGGPSAGAVLVVVNADGTEEVLPKTARAPHGLTAELPEGAVLKVVDASASFPDVAGTWYGEQGVADFVGARGILTGVPQADGALRFEGGAATTRAMFVTMLHRAESCPDAPDAGFADAAGLWFEGAAAWGEATGVVDGYGGSSFGGDDSVTREQMAVFLMRYAEHLGLDVSARADLSEFPDGSEASPWASQAMSWAVAWGLFSGRDGQLDPADGATRAEASAVVMRFINAMYA